MFFAGICLYVNTHAIGFKNYNLTEFFFSRMKVKS